MALTAPVVDTDFFAENGYLVVDDVLDQELDVLPVVREYMELLDRLAQEWVADGTLTSLHDDLPFPQRVGRILTETGPAGFMPLDISLRTRGITAQTPMHVGPAVFGLITSPRLLDVVEQIIGSEILSNPIQHVRIKPPEHMLPSSGLGPQLYWRSPWHQDQGVALPEIDDTNMLTVWVAITDADEENGCLCVVPGSHLGGLATHCPGKGDLPLHIPESLVREAGPVQPLPVRSGGVVMFHKQTMHSSLSNASDAIRWSFDLRYQPIGEPTGRPLYPDFVARSRKDPTSVLTDWREWAELWGRTRSRLAADTSGFDGPVNRWDGTDLVCA